MDIDNSQTSHTSQAESENVSVEAEL
jgi:hypothetical protein